MAACRRQLDESDIEWELTTYPRMMCSSFSLRSSVSLLTFQPSDGSPSRLVALAGQRSRS